MTLASPSPANHWFEPAAETDGLPLRAFLQDNGAGGFMPATTGSEDAALVDIDGSGVYALVSLIDRLYLIDNGSGGLALDATGPSFAVLIANGSGGYVPTTDLTNQEAAAFFALGDGRYALLSLDSDTTYLKMLDIDGIVTLYH